MMRKCSSPRRCFRCSGLYLPRCQPRLERAVSGSSSTQVIDFCGDMKPPRLLEGAEISFTREALQAHVRRTMVVQCTITVEGRVTCRDDGWTTGCAS